MALILGAIAYHGLRWDESIEHAQILTGDVVYPDGHPIQRYVETAPSGQTLLSAIVLGAADSVWILAALRNAIFLMATFIPVYLLARPGGRAAAWWAVPLVAAGAFLEFDGSYPMSVWHNTFTNGHIGTGYMLLCVAALALKRWRTAALLIGLAPAVHVGQAPPIFILGFAAAIYAIRQNGFRPVLRCLPGFVFGAIVSVFVFVLSIGGDETLSQSSPYAVSGNVEEIWRAYTFHHDIHRFLPSVNGWIGLALTLIVSGLVALRSRNLPLEFSAAYHVMSLYAVIVSAIVIAAAAFHYTLGDATPFWIMAPMPYRLINHLPPILLAMGLGFIFVYRGDRGRIVPSMFFVVLLVMAFVGRSNQFRGVPFVDEYLRGSEFILFMIAGAVMGLCMFTNDLAEPPRLHWGAVPVLAAMLLAPFHQFGAALVVLGAVAGVAIGFAPLIAWENPLQPKRVWRAAPALLAITVVFVSMQDRQPHLRVGAFEGAVKEHLADEPDAMIAAAPDAFLMQAQTGHPVFVETATMSLLSYMPDLGPVINAMYTDVYGMPISEPRASRTPWTETWSARTPEEWRELRRWEIDYIAAPEDLTLSLTPAIEAGGQRLYRLPE